MDQLYVTREAIEAYERRTGFQGLGQFMLDKGLFVLRRKNDAKPLEPLPAIHASLPQLHNETNRGSRSLYSEFI